MKEPRFTESEIVGILREADAGMTVGDPQAWDQHHSLLQVEVQVRGTGHLRGKAAQGARG